MLPYEIRGAIPSDEDALLDVALFLNTVNLPDDRESIRGILIALHTHGYSASNLGFGMGGANLQKLNRDTQKFAFKCSEATVDGASVKVFKDPATDNGKRSKGGRLSLVQDGGRLRTVEGGRKDDLLVPVFEDGKILVQHTFEEVRKNTMRGLF